MDGWVPWEADVADVMTLFLYVFGYFWMMPSDKNIAITRAYRGIKIILPHVSHWNLQIHDRPNQPRRSCSCPSLFSIRQPSYINELVFESGPPAQTSQVPQFNSSSDCGIWTHCTCLWDLLYVLWFSIFCFSQIMTSFPHSYPPKRPVSKISYLGPHLLHRHLTLWHSTCGTTVIALPNPLIDPEELYLCGRLDTICTRLLVPLFWYDWYTYTSALNISLPFLSHSVLSSPRDCGPVPPSCEEGLIPCVKLLLYSVATTLTILANHRKRQWPRQLKFSSLRGVKYQMREKIQQLLYLLLSDQEVMERQYIAEKSTKAPQNIGPTHTHPRAENL